MNKGLWFALGAYGAWGVLPIYWKWLHHVPALQLVGHRIVWSAVLLVLFIVLARQWGTFRASVADRRVLLRYAVASALLSVNWLTYVWAVNAGFIVETSLGYFINPLVSILLGVVFLRERLRAGQWAAIALAAVGVLYLTLVYGALPWIALTLAATFGVYGLVKKTAPLGSVHGLALEAGILFVPAVAVLVAAQISGTGEFLHGGPVPDALMVGTGVVTSVPLVLFAAAARRIPLSHIGIMQYSAPTLQFLIGVAIYREPFTTAHFTGFAIVWAALIVFVVEGFLARRAQVAAAVDEGLAP